MMSDEQWAVYHAAREAFLDRAAARIVTREVPDCMAYKVIVEEEVRNVIGWQKMPPTYFDQTPKTYPIYGIPRSLVTTWVVARFDLVNDPCRVIDMARAARREHDRAANAA